MPTSCKQSRKKFYLNGCLLGKVYAQRMSKLSGKLLNSVIYCLKSHLTIKLSFLAIIDEYCVYVFFRAGIGKMEQRVRELESKREVLCLWSWFLFHGLGYVLNRQGDHRSAMLPKKLCDHPHDFLLVWHSQELLETFLYMDCNGRGYMLIISATESTMKRVTLAWEDHLSPSHQSIPLQERKISSILICAFLWKYQFTVCRRDGICTFPFVHTRCDWLYCTSRGTHCTGVEYSCLPSLACHGQSWDQQIPQVAGEWIRREVSCYAS